MLEETNDISGKSNLLFFSQCCGTERELFITVPAPIFDKLLFLFLLRI
jgi:hypothetical protein